MQPTIERLTDLFSLVGKTALITGSNRGIGRGIADALAEFGAEVIIHCSRDVSRAQAAAGEIAATYGTPAHGIAVDLAEANAGEQLHTAALAVVDHMDILVLNASVQVRKNWQAITDDEYNLQMDVNLRSTIQSIQKFLPDMIERRWGRVLTIGSVQQIRPHPEMLVYAASKDAQMSVVRNLAKQVGGYGITVNNLAPGVILTDRNTDALADEAYRQYVIEHIPVGFLGTVHDCNGAALLLCSEAGRYINGVNLVVDGGMHL